MQVTAGKIDELAKKLKELGVEVKEGKIQKSFLNKAKKAAKELFNAKFYNYNVVTHGVFKFDPVDGEGGDYVVGDEPTDEMIQEAIDADWAEFDKELGLGEYAKDIIQDSKIIIPAPKVDITHTNRFQLLWDIKVNKKLSPAEEQELLAYIQGQCSDGWGEGFEQHKIKDYEGQCEMDCNCEDYVELDEDENPIGKCPECKGKGYKNVDCDLYVSPWDRKRQDKDNIKAE